MRELTLSEKIARAEAAVAVENLQGRHVYYHAGGDHKSEYEDIWCKEGEVAWAHNYGTWFREKFYENYVEGQITDSQERYERFVKKDPEIAGKNDPRRIMSYPIHHITTPLIEVAEDGQSAKGLWYTTGLGFSNVPGHREAGWMWERYGGDYVLENGEWKLRFLRIGMDIGGPVDTIDVFTPPGPPPQEDEEGPGGPESDETEEFTEDNAFADQPGVHKTYSLTQVPQDDPRMPEPYAALGETWKYVEI